MIRTPTSEFQGASDELEELDFMGTFDPMPTHEDEEEIESDPTTLKIPMMQLIQTIQISVMTMTLTEQSVI